MVESDGVVLPVTCSQSRLGTTQQGVRGAAAPRKKFFGVFFGQFFYVTVIFRCAFVATARFVVVSDRALGI